MYAESKKSIMLPFILILSSITCSNAGVLISGSYGGWCGDECEHRGGSYRYCTTNENSWDYCSILEGAGSYGKICRTDHPCGHHDYSYMWCRTTDDSWDYCSEYRTSEYSGLTRYGYFCKSACELKRDDSYYKCSDLNSDQDYCSPKPYSTAKGEQCELTHYCAKYGKSYYWCYTDLTSKTWDYCSPRENCAYWPSPQNDTSSGLTRRILPESHICTIRATPSLTTTFRVYNNNPYRIRAVSPGVERLRAEQAIGRLDISRFECNGQPDTIVTLREVRIDFQGSFTSPDGVRYAHIQVQIGCDTLAGILVRTGQTFPPRYIRRALHESLNMHVIVYLYQE